MNHRDLHDVLWYSILQYLNTHELIAIRQCDDYFYKLTNYQITVMNRLWRQQCVVLVPRITTIDYAPVYWYELYRFLHTCIQHVPTWLEVLNDEKHSLFDRKLFIMDKCVSLDYVVLLDFGARVLKENILQESGKNSSCWPLVVGSTKYHVRAPYAAIHFRNKNIDTCSMVKWLITPQQVNLGLVESTGDTLLMVAARHDQVEVVKLLLQDPRMTPRIINMYGQGDEFDWRFLLGQ